MAQAQHPSGSPSYFPWTGWARTVEAMSYSAAASKAYVTGLRRYSRQFTQCFVSSSALFAGVEMARAPTREPTKAVAAYTKLLNTNLELARRAMFASLTAINDFTHSEVERASAAWLTTWLGGEGETIDEYARRLAQITRAVVEDYPEAIEAIEPDYGFHFERGYNPLMAETDRFLLYRIVPSDPSVKVDEGSKPLIILPPYVLGSNILAFLPGEGRSYAHAFANQGVPTYIRIMKPVAETEALQVISGEDDVRDTRLFCEKVMAAHGRRVTLNGYCQGGYTAVVNLASGELDGLVDALVTCVSPMDGTRSDGLAGFLASLPDEFNDLDYGTKTLANGNRVADGDLMGWIYKLKSIESENPLSSYYRDLGMFSRKDPERAVSRSAAAISYWLANERSDLPLAITRMSYGSYRTPIADDGTLPLELFGRKLSLKRIQAMGIPWLICYGEKDDLVEKECALAPTDHVDAELTEFPRGHVAIATSWSNPESKCALHTVFGDGYRGPVRFQLDLDAEGRAEKEGKKAKKATPTTRRSKARKPR